MLLRLLGWLKSLAPIDLRGDKPFVLSEHFQQTRAGVAPPVDAGASRPAERLWVLSRGCYAVKLLELASVPANKRDAAIRLAIASWTPFTNTAHYIIPGGGSVTLCAWDSDATSPHLDARSPSSAAIRVVPESALRSGRASQRGDMAKAVAEIHHAIEGYVGVVFAEDGRWLAEQWWPALPTPVNWRNFLRSASISESIDATMPQPTTPAWLAQPLGYAANQTIHTISRRESLALAAAALLLAIPTLWYANELRQLVALKQQATQRLLSTEKDLNVVLDSRELALTSQERAVQLAKLFNQPEPLQLLTVINDVVSQNSAAGALQLADWDLRPQQLKFSLIAVTGAPPAATAMVKALERINVFRDVEAKTDGTRINITVGLVAPSLNATPNAADAPVSPPPPTRKALTTVTPTQSVPTPPAASLTATVLPTTSA